jgi:hypothetical protein
MDATAFSWRIRSTVTGLFSEARFAGDLTGREDSTPYAVTSDPAFSPVTTRRMRPLALKPSVIPNVAGLAVNADQRR